MKKYLYALITLGICILTLSFRLNNNPVTGAEQPEKYNALLKGQSVAVLANQTSLAGKDHLVDVLIRNGIDVRVIFAPEHGFREMADAGETINDGKDTKTGVNVISLYGKHNKPTKEDLEGIDVVVFDIQDVGTRFYTYISTLHYLLEACAQNGVSCIVLDRPNPNGFYVDGNILDTAYRSFVGLDPVPVVHGMTVGEYALMLNGEGWLGNNLKCDLKVITCKNYTHDTKYELPVKPSPNLPNQVSVYLYPSLCFFEGTNISVGRGTAFPFQVYGAPELPDKGFSFIPESVPGAKNPPFLGQKCFGRDLRNAITEKIVPSPQLNLGWVIEAYKSYPEKDKFFTSYFDVLAGGPTLRQQIISGKTAEEIRASWKEGLEKFKKIRRKYLLYK
jgi:uncharacterized protein YbbC (DUF1343 family)